MVPQLSLHVGTVLSGKTASFPPLPPISQAEKVQEEYQQHWRGPIMDGHTEGSLEETLRG